MTALKRLDDYRDLGPLLLRLALAAILLYYGLPKFTQYATFVGLFTKWGLPAPAVSVILNGIVEVGGGVLVLLGLFTRPAAVALGFNFVIAILYVNLPNGFATAKGGFAWPMLVLAAVLTLLFVGPGRFSLDAGSEARAEAPRTASQ